MRKVKVKRLRKAFLKEVGAQEPKPGDWRRYKKANRHTK